MTDVKSPEKVNLQIDSLDEKKESPVDEETLTRLAIQFDQSRMGQVIDRLPDQIEIALEQDIRGIPSGPFNRVLVVGMGGSALPVDVLCDAFSEQLRVPVGITRHYELPSSIDEKCLVIASSFSGGTEEVLSAMEHFPKDAQNIVAISGGGELSSQAGSMGYPVIHIPKEREPEGFQPRSAVGYFVTLMSRLLHEAGVMDDPRPELETVPQFLRESPIKLSADETAAWLKNRIPVIYTDEKHLSSIARIAKIKFNENAKRPAFFNALPEANHNEMIGFCNPLGNYGLLYFHDPASHPRIRKRFLVMEKVFAREAIDNVSFREWPIPVGSNIQKVFAALLFAERCAYTLALLDGIDPTPVALVERFKKLLIQ
ncbi:MAG: hypothetical protein HQ559_06655 [Lentisphaerae bacterium]|nr:hypothetical protein [Lentisphaerota bacterium]